MNINKELEQYKDYFDAYNRGEIMRKDIIEQIGNMKTLQVFNYFSERIKDGDYDMNLQKEERLVIYQVLHDKYSFSNAYSNNMVKDIMNALNESKYQIKKIHGNLKSEQKNNA